MISVGRTAADTAGGRYDPRRGENAKPSRRPVARGSPPPAPPAPAPEPADAADRFVEDQLFEEDVRAVIALMRPHRRERLMGWTEYRTGGANFRATVSWDASFERAPQSPEEQCLSVPRLADVLESILVGSVKDQDGLTAAEEFDIYRAVLRDLYRRLDEIQGRYE
jgi:hypothetical protein